MVTPDVLARLRQRVLGDPSDLSTLEVFADALLEVGDDLGAHIREALSGEEPELSVELGERLLGRLHPHVLAFQVQHGFLRRVSLAGMPVAHLRRLTGVPEWEGVTTITLGRRRRPRGALMPAATVLPLLRHPVCRHVREVNNLGFDAFLALCEGDRPYERLHLAGLPYWGQNTPLTRGALTVRELALDGAESGYGAVLAWLKTWGRSVFDRVEVLRLEGTWHDDLCAALEGAGAGLQTIVAGRWTATREGAKWHVVTTLGGNGYGRTQHAVELELAQLPLTVSQTANRLARLTVRMPQVADEQLQRLREAANAVPLSFEWQEPIGELPYDDLPF